MKNMKSRKIFMLIAMAIVIILVVVLIVVNVTKSNQPGVTDNNQNNKVEQNKPQEEFTKEDVNGNKTNTSDALKKERQQLGYSIKNITLSKKDAQTVFALELANNSAKEMPSKMVNIVFLDKSGKEVSKMALYIRAIKPGSSIKTQATVNNDFTNVYDFKIEERK